ncbi:MAG: 3'(2'),5'-bisphosphate nucleotidase CysQ [Pseudomonadota bacterium]
MDDLQQLQDVFLEAARRACGAVQAVYVSDFSVDRKSDQSPVTEADLAAEAAILDHLRTCHVGIPVVSEEAVAAGIIPDLAASYILVDPLDGTREFVNRNGEFTVNIALVVEGEPVLGAVFAPALDEAFWGLKGQGAYRSCIGADGADMRADATRIQVAEGVNADWRAVASRSHLSSETEAFLARNPIGETVSFGSSLKLCRLAEGRADIYPRLSPTNQWDIAAGDAVLRAAGGITVDTQGQIFCYEAPKPLRAKGFLNPWFVACGGIDPSQVSF